MVDDHHALQLKPFSYKRNAFLFSKLNKFMKINFCNVKVIAKKFFPKNHMLTIFLLPSDLKVSAKLLFCKIWQRLRHILR